jgi:hypothetical protein
LGLHPPRLVGGGPAPPPTSLFDEEGVCEVAVRNRKLPPPVAGAGEGRQYVDRVAELAILAGVSWSVVRSSGDHQLWHSRFSTAACVGSSIW